MPLLLSLVTVFNRSRGFVDSELLSSLLGLYGLLVLTFNIIISGHISALRSDLDPPSPDSFCILS